MQPPSHVDGLPQTQIDLSLSRTPLPAPLAHNQIQIPGYAILDLLGQGGMGVVYRARQLGLNRIVALKMVLAGRYADADDRARFRLEAEAVAALKHPNIVQVYEIGEYDSSPYFSLEYVDGGTLAQLIDGRPQDPRFAAQIVEQIARAMHTAHNLQIVHRDLKPANVLLAGNRRQETGDRRQDSGKTGSELSSVSCSLTPKITDFGLAKRLDSDSDLTATGIVAGTPQYMAPEQVTGLRGTIGPWVDIYALGVLLYEMLTGYPPFLASNQAETLHRVLHDLPSSPRITQPEVPRDLETICLKCLEKSPLRRYATAADLADDLVRFLNHEPIVARPLSSVERGWRWCRRNPRLAASLVAIFVTLALGVAVSTFFAVEAAHHAYEAEWIAQQYLAQKVEAEQIAGELRVQRTLAEERATEAQTAQKDADAARAVETRLKQTALAREQTRVRELYAAHMTLAQRAWDDGNLSRLDQLMNRYVPASLGAPDHRGFEWYHLDSVRQLRSFTFLFPAGATCLAGSPDGRVHLWAGFEDVVIRTATDEEVMYKTFDATNRVVHAAFSPNNKLVVTAAQNGVLQVRDAKTTGLLKTLPWSADLVHAVEFSPDGRYFVAAGGPNGVNSQGTCVIWNVSDWTIRHRLPRFAAPVRSVSFTPDGTTLLVAPDGTPLSAWNPETGAPLPRQFTLPAIWIAASRTKKLYAAVEFGRPEIHILDAVSGAKLRTLRGMYGEPGAITLGPDGVHLACASQDNSIWVWNIESGELLHRYRGHRARVMGLAFDLNGMLYSSSEDSVHTAWWPQHGLDYTTIRPDWTYAIRTLLPPSAYDQMHCVHGWGLVGRLDLKDGKWSRVSKEPPKLDRGAAVLGPGRKEVLVIPQQGECVATSLETGVARPFPLVGLAPQPVYAEATPDGRFLVTGHRDGTVQLHNLERPFQPRTVKHGTTLHRVAIRPDGKQFAAVAGDGVVAFFDAETGADRFVGQMPNPVQSFLAYTPDGKELVTTSMVSEVLLFWDTTTGQQTRTIEGIPRHTAGLRFAPDGRRIALWTDRTITLRDTETGLETYSVQAPDRVLDLQFTQDSYGLVTTDGFEVRYWSGRPAVATDWRRRANQTFRPDTIRVAEPPQPGGRLKVTLTLANNAGHPYRPPTKDHVPEAPGISTMIAVKRVGQTPKGPSVLINWVEFPITTEVAANGRIEHTFTVGSLPKEPGRYVVLFDLNNGHYGKQATPSVEFELK